VLIHVRHAAGFQLVAAPLPCQSGATFVEYKGAFWELSDWLPGVADFHANENAARLHSAMTSLAQLHQALATASADAEGSESVSPGILARLQQIEELRNCGVRRLKAALADIAEAWPEFCLLGESILRQIEPRLFEVRNRLDIASSIQCRLKPCLRDVWHDHVLFIGDRVSGIIDYGAMRIETVTGDIARLVGSLVGSDQEKWNTAIRSYQSVRQLSSDELQLVEVFDQSGCVLSGVNWIEWVAVQRREFANRDAVIRCLAEIAARLHESPIVLT